ncbi:putative gustatory receptor 28b [Leptopilina heterotoma]|uniref:putative gustatory receptor 28b n=1 Tax=Leptopilina heterotoma TaxID=63436 RepID=UPI001CA93854|nr:putative gustatory receptor 28b [Leptopilina heterotoma]
MINTMEMEKTKFEMNADKNNRMMTQTKSIKDIIKPLQIVSWSLGSGIIEIPMGTPRFFITILYAIILLSIYGVSLFYTVNYEDKMYLKRLNNTGRFLTKIVTLGNGCLGLIAIILAWNRRKGLKICIQKIERVDDLLQKIGISKDYDKTIKQELGRVCAIYIIVIIVIVINSASMVDGDTPKNVKAAMIIAVHYPLALIFVADSVFLVIVRSMRRKFSRLNSLLKSMSSASPLSPQYMKLLYQNTSLVKSNNSVLNKKTNDDAHLMKAAKQIHLNLVKTSRRVNETFGLQILLSMALSLVFITGLLYFSYSILYSPQLDQKEKTPALISSGCWLFLYVMKILFINHICDRTSGEALLTGNIICELHEPMTSKEFRSEIRQFVLQLIQNPLKFTAYEFVTLDYTFIQGVVGSITTYLVILIQLSTDIGGNNKNNATLADSMNKTV